MFINNSTELGLCSRQGKQHVRPLSRCFVYLPRCTSNGLHKTWFTKWNRML